MYSCSETQAVCRGCGKPLDGSPCFKGGSAYVPTSHERAKTNHYGGWVCSRECDYRAAMEQEQSMPGCGGYRGRLCMAYQHGELDDKWAVGLRAGGGK